MINPSQDQINILFSLYQSGQIERAEDLSRQSLQIYPQSVILLNFLGVILSVQGKFLQAVSSYDKAIELNPNIAEAHSNRGNALINLGRLEEAVSSYDKSIELKPNIAEAHSNRGNALINLGRLEEAIKNCDKAIELKPNFAQAYYNRGNALTCQGQIEASVESYNKAIELKPNFAQAYSNLGNALAHLGDVETAVANHRKSISIIPDDDSLLAAFASCLRTAEFKSCSDGLLHDLLQVLESSTVSAKHVSNAVASALRYYPKFLHFFRLFKSNYVDEDIDQITQELSTIPLLLRLMELSSIPDLDMERMFSKIRTLMLNRLISREGEAHGLPFYIALAIHCFNNEYVFFELEEEKQKIELLQEEVRCALEKGEFISPTRIAILGAYRSLSVFSWADDLLKIEWSSEINKVISAQLINVKKEQSLRPKIHCLTSIEDQISQSVRKQYEENPYPRWIKIGLKDKPRTIRQVLKEANMHLHLDAQQFSNRPDILIAGCGTGQHALITASKFLNCKVLAIDLSLNSLSYAMRKTQELGITNIEYMQADILKLNLLKSQFDIIESVGVLHHMDDPIAGWKVLVDRLRPGGLMMIGLYSEIARQHLIELREHIREKKYTTTPDDIRKFRKDITSISLNFDSETTKTFSSHDFYSLSPCRDLLFHVQEHRFSLPQIETALRDLDLKFLGFALQKSHLISFSKLYPEKDAIKSLFLWHQFELKKPDTFIELYRFWVQKV